MPPLKKNEKIMLAAISILIVIGVIMDPYYIIWKDPPVPEETTPVPGAKPGAPAQPAAKPAAKPAPAKPGAAPQAGAAAVADSRPKSDPIPFVNWGRDPFIQVKRQADEATAISALSLSGISVKGKDRYALINSQIIHTGDMIGGFTVAKIEKDFVLLTRGGQTYTLTWGSR